MKTGEEWREGISRGTQERIRDRRRELGLTMDELSERTAKIGFEIPRSTLANIEIQRKAHVALHEVLVLAEALESSPAAIIAGDGDSEVEILPGRTVASAEAQEWIAGASGIRKAQLAIRQARDALTSALRVM
ncbi:helix-turn-helix domain-containing protein [Brevibacterium antiquum]|nr:helix-turn-helix transcriptional regulator [Brevibacterium antiquum]